MALELLVFDGKLHADSSNWSCPFGECKAHFLDRKVLMQHVSTCTHFSDCDEKAYCNSCTEYDCFALQSRHQQFCRAEESVENGEGKRSKTKRMLKSVFTLSRSSSRSSSPIDGPSSVSGRQSVLSMMSLSPSSPHRSEKRAAAYSPPSPSQAFEAPRPAAPQEVHSDPAPALFELSDNMIARPEELPASESAGTVPAWNDELVSAYSENACSAPMYVDLQEFTESPTEDVSMESRMPEWNMQSGYEPGSSHVAAASQAHYPHANAMHSVSQVSIGEPQRAPWGFAQQNGASFHSEAMISPATPASAQGGTYFPNGTSTGDVAMNVSAYSHPPTSDANWQYAPARPSQTRNRSGDSWASTATMVSTQSSHSQSPIAEAGGYHCPYPDCDYHPRGKTAYWDVYLTKHINNQHLASKIPCQHCGKMIGRRDNLKTHQKNSCPAARVQGASSQPPMWTMGPQAMAY